MLEVSRSTSDAIFLQSKIFVLLTLTTGIGKQFNSICCYRFFNNIVF